MREVFGRPGAVGPVWGAAAAATALAVLAPLLSLALTALGAGAAHWSHLGAHVLPRAAANTALLLAGVGLVTGVVGTGCAWLVTQAEFPGRRVLQWALLLPLAVPTYIVAYSYVDLLHPIGPIQTALRALLGFDSPRQFRLPDVRSMAGAVLVLSAVLYPYVYLSMRAMFSTQPARLMEAARLLGEGPWGAFRRVALPMARPALAVGLGLALLEVLNDVGASEFMGVTTLTTSIYTTWVTRSDLGAAAQIACAMLLMVVALVWLERQGRRRQRLGVVRAMSAAPRRQLRGPRAWLATTAAALPVLLGFVLPAGHLAAQAWKRAAEGHGFSAEVLAGAMNSAALALGVTAIAVVLGLIVAWAARAGDGRSPTWLLRGASLGYAIPGTVLALGLLPPALAVDGWIAAALGLPGLPLMSLGAVLVVACVMRFLAMPVGGVEAGLARLPRQLEQVSRSLGESALGTLRRVHLPLLRPALTASALLVFIDVMKELPATLLLRPANFETLPTLLYAEASRGSYEHGALAALLIVAVGLPAVLLLSREPSPSPAPAPTAPDLTDYIAMKEAT
ncbi:iron ABC transporter permease [Roseateles aquatilis]|uniref:Iron ABC transporter permease n=1 Tax=Roseateles aquatilis TaxID=431061 RepID=A0A2D0ALR4_9BURK|nr:iron ABC transporter permease [Roseateles aquatilis]OWQ83053.1 iron ABC transporter permease [Roseateles aquatilis]